MTDLPAISDRRALPHPVGAERFGSTMLRRFGWFYRLLGLQWAMERVRFEEHSVDRIRTAADQGPVVYVLLRRSQLDHLALNAVLNRRRLPLSQWAPGVTSFWWQPVAEAWTDLFGRLRAWWSEGRAPDPVGSGWLSRAVATGTTATVFLRDQDLPLLPSQTPDALDALITAQAACDRPIQLVPIIVVWNPAPDVERSAAATFLLGSQEEPGLLTSLRRLYAPGNRAPFVQAGEPLDLSEFITRTADDEPRQRLQALTTLLRRYLKRESKVVRGPTLLPYPDMKRVVLDNPPMRAFAADEARSTGLSTDQVAAALSREYDLIAANFSWPWVAFCSVAMKPLWNRVFSGYDIRPEDLERIRAASRQGAAVVVPCHKSHFDYLLMSWVFYHADMIVPHVVAGINLAIWPVSIALRGLGGFFVKRSFSGERLHPVVFARYLRELLRHGYPVEFFIEGGRTRTGLLLRPRLGVLGMAVDAAASGALDHELIFLPVAIAYEQVAEERAYRQELAGGEKEKESVGQLIQARSVLSRRFGRVYLRVGEPIRCGEALAGLDWAAMDEAARKPVLQAIGDRIVHRIGAAMVVLPTSLVALAMLAHHRQAILQSELMARLLRLRALLQRKGAPESDSLAGVEGAVVAALDRFARDGLIKPHVGEGDRIWQIVPETRSLLDFHKNQVLHYLAPAAIAAAAIRAMPPDGPFTAADLRPGWELVERVLSRELTPDPDRGSDDRLRDALDDLVAHEALIAVGDGYRLASADRIGEIHGLLRALLESYLLVLRACRGHADRVIDSKPFLKDLQGDGAALLAAGRITRPEALNAVALKNALAVAGDLGALTRDPTDDPKGRSSRWRVETPALDELLASLAPMVDA